MEGLGGPARSPRRAGPIASAWGANACTSRQAGEQCHRADARDIDPAPGRFAGGVGLSAEAGGFAGMQSGVPAHTDTMPVRLHHIVIDAHDLPGLARFWTQALGWKVLSEREREIVIGTDENAPVGMCFMPVTDPKRVKNRVHLDLTSSAQDRDQEIKRLVALGARRVDIGQTGAESWTVLADPEGNEFCVIRPKETLTR
jgi:predicted enzyme related to lactoylglutathione lyase